MLPLLAFVLALQQTSPVPSPVPAAPSEADGYWQQVVHYRTVARLDERSSTADAGLGASLRGRVFDREVRLQADFPLYVRVPAFAVGEDEPYPEQVKFRWAFSFNDLW